MEIPLDQIVSTLLQNFLEFAVVLEKNFDCTKSETDLSRGRGATDPFKKNFLNILYILLGCKIEIDPPFFVTPLNFVLKKIDPFNL